MKWPTSAVCFGPPLGQSELLVWTERELGRGRELDWRAKVELYEQIRREYEFGAGTIVGVARKLGVHRRMVREAVRSAMPARRKKTERPHLKIAPAAAFIERFWQRTARRRASSGTRRSGSGSVSVSKCRDARQPSAQSAVCGAAQAGAGLRAARDFCAAELRVWR